MYKLILSVNNLEEVMVWPSVPPDFGPEQAQRNGTYEGISGDFNTLGPMGLWSIPLDFSCYFIHKIHDFLFVKYVIKLQCQSQVLLNKTPNYFVQYTALIIPGQETKREQY